MDLLELAAVGVSDEIGHEAGPDFNNLRPSATQHVFSVRLFYRATQSCDYYFSLTFWSTLTAGYIHAIHSQVPS